MPAFKGIFDNLVMIELVYLLGVLKWRLTTWWCIYGGITFESIGLKLMGLKYKTSVCILCIYV